MSTQTTENASDANKNDGRTGSTSPKVFISYSWTTPGHQALVREWAERLISDEVDVVMDIYDFKEGDDKYAFMEGMVSDESVTHVLVLSDKAYAEKADARRAGVGTESQIISKEVYDKVRQSKFIPIVCEFDGSEPCLPVFLRNRKWIDFSTPEAVNENWEQLIRVLYGKPYYVKPAKGKRPAYLGEEGAPSSPAISKYAALRQAILQGKPALQVYRQDFLDACIAYADTLRVRTRPAEQDFGQKVLADCGRLKVVRDHITDWVLLEAAAAPSKAFVDSLISLLERMRELKSRPPEVTHWSDSWFDAHATFVHETFLYIISALIKSGADNAIYEVLTSTYLAPEVDDYGRGQFDRFYCFRAQGETLQAVLAPDGQRLLSPVAALIKRQADRSDTPFEAIIEAELVVMMMAFVVDGARWYPSVLFYGGRRSYPLFVRATQHRGFRRLAAITGLSTGDDLRAAISKGMERLRVAEWQEVSFHADISFPASMNLEKLDTLK